MCGTSRRGRSALALTCLFVCATALGIAAAPSASAHTTPPTIVTTIESVQPSAPNGVSVAVATSVAEELVVTNTSSTPVEALSAKGEPFVRIVRGKVEGNFNNPDWWITNDPLGALHVPEAAKVGAAPRWVTVSSSDTWAWFDHRMHPSALVVPLAITNANRDALLSRWSVPLRYGDTALTVNGKVEYRPIRGGYFVRVNIDTGKPDGVSLITIGALQGRLPGLFVRVPKGHTLAIAGSDGKPFARIDDSGAEVYTASPTWIADQQARGNPPDGAPGRWLRVSTSPNLVWLDPRLAPDQDQPSAAIMAHDGITTIKMAEPIPVTIDGASTTIVGLVEWHPASSVGAKKSGGAGSFVLIGVGALAVLAGLVLVLRVLRRRAGSDASPSA